MYKLVVMEFVLTDSSHSIGLSTGTSSRSLPCTYIFTDTKNRVIWVASDFIGQAIISPVVVSVYGVSATTL